MSDLINPVKKGSFVTRRIIYAQKNLKYPDSLNEYRLFETPENNYDTQPFSLVPFGELPQNHDWPFTPNNVPLNGIIHLPQDVGKFPLIIIAHGNHSPFENSTVGYDYLGELFSSQGVIFTSIDVNFLNGRNRGENDARAILHLEHIKQFKKWNEDSSHPLHNKVDLDKIIVIGHSRGGEAVGHLSFFNKLDFFQPESYTPPIYFDGSKGFGPYKFNINAVIAIAPTHKQYQPYNRTSQIVDNYFIIHGSADNDVSDFQGYLTYDDISPVNQATENTKALMWVHGANHNYFNSRWQNEAQIPTISRYDQENIMALYIASIKEAYFNKKKEYLDAITDVNKVYSERWIDKSIKFTTQFEPADKIILQDFPNKYLQLNPGLTGSIEKNNVEVKVIPFYFEKRYPQVPGLVVFDSGKHLYQNTFGLSLKWNSSNAYYKLKFNPSELKLSEYNNIMLRVGQSFESENSYGKSQDFILRITDLNNNSADFQVGNLTDLVYPAKSHSPSEPKTVMQSINLMNKQIINEGLDYLKVNSISLRFDSINNPKGIIYLDSIQLTKKFLEDDQPAI